MTAAVPDILIDHGPDHGPLAFIGVGRHRATFLAPCGTRVFKVPLAESGREAVCCCSRTQCTCYGEMDNGREFRTYMRHGDKPDINGITYARCWYPSFPESTVLAMEYVEPSVSGRRPKWADYVDGGQVGRTYDGRWVAYDFGW